MNYYFILLIVFLVVIYILFVKKNRNHITYYKCHKTRNNKILQTLLDTNNIIKNNNDWDLYIPHTYTYLEDELKQLKITNNNQKIFGVKGCDYLVAKDNLWFYFNKKLGRNNSTNYLPNTYVLKNSKDMDLFINDYSKNKVYLLKKNLQRKMGIKITKNKGEILNAYNNDYVVVQEYIPNLYLIQNRKINLRMYLLIICKNNKKYWYISRLGKCLYTNKEYDKHNIYDPEMHLTSLNLSQQIYDTLPLSLEELKLYIGASHYKVLFSRILEILKKCKVVFNDLICQNSYTNTYFQLFGIDIVFTKDMIPYLLEINKGPEMKAINQKDKYIKQQIYTDIFNYIIFNSQTSLKHFLII